MNPELPKALTSAGDSAGKLGVLLDDLAALALKVKDEINVVGGYIKQIHGAAVSGALPETISPAQVESPARQNKAQAEGFAPHSSSPVSAEVPVKK